MSSALLDSDRLIGGRYALEELLGKGGMGEVWRARHVTLKSFVAIKFLHGGSASDEATRKRFLTEAQVTANLKSRHAVQVFDFGVTEEGLPYLVMELLEGETLDKRIARDGHLSIEVVVPILQKAARALDRAHAVGIVHRDFKPENVMVFPDEEGRDDVKVVDFGIAKLLGELEAAPTGSMLGPDVDPRMTFTRTGNMVGTPYYMAPEQVNDPTQVGPAADIWAFGVVAYECLTGQRPFDGESVRLLLQSVLSGKPVERGSAIARIPKLFDEWFAVACSPDPAIRFPDATTAVTALSIALERVPAATPSGDRNSLADVSSPSGNESKKKVASPFSETLDARASGVVFRQLGTDSSSSLAVPPAEATNDTAGEPAAAAQISRPLLLALAALGVAVAFVILRLVMPGASPPTGASTAAATAAPAETTPVAASPATAAAVARGADAPPDVLEPTSKSTAARVNNRAPLGARKPIATASAAAAPPTVSALAPPPPPPTPSAPKAPSPFQLPPLGL